MSDNLFRSKDGSRWPTEVESDERDYQLIIVERDDLEWLRAVIIADMDDSTQRDMALQLIAIALATPSQEEGT